MKKAVVVSLRFSPAFVQHAVAYAKALRELGFDPRFLLHSAYRAFPELDALSPVAFDFAPAEGKPLSHAVFLNTSARNAASARQFKKAGARILYLYHEPWNFSSDYLRREGIKATATTILAHQASIPMLKLADAVVLESQYGVKLYRDSDIRYNPNAHYFSQIYDDESVELPDQSPEKKVYFSYIGNISRPHGFDQFVAVVREFLRRNVDMRFLIASKDRLPGSVADDKLFREYSGRVEFHCGRPLASAEINRLFAESFCVWNLYRRSTQSGVLPKAFMFGTPVIAGDLGSFPEFVRDGWNGKFTSAEDYVGILQALEDIRNRQPEYAGNCRATFLKTFYYKSRLGDLERLLR